MIRRMLMTAALSVITFSALARPAAAQVCNGGLSFSRAPTQIRVGGAFATGETDVDAAVGGGNRRTGVFGAALFQYADATDIESHALIGGGAVGADLVVSDDRAGHVIAICPLGSVVFSNGPDIPPLDASFINVSVGGQMGLSMPVGPRVRAVPTFGAALETRRNTISGGAVSVSNTIHFGEANVGIGFDFGRVALTPRVQIPFSLPEGVTGHAAFVVDLSFGY